MGRISDGGGELGGIGFARLPVGRQGGGQIGDQRRQPGAVSLDAVGEGGHTGAVLGGNSAAPAIDAALHIEAEAAGAGAGKEGDHADQDHQGAIQHDTNIPSRSQPCQRSNFVWPR